MRIVIIGGGAAGCACASLLAKTFKGRTSADRGAAEVLLFEKNEVLGGQATSIDIDAKQYGASFLNDGVQGGSPAFKHTFRQFRALGLEEKEVELKISFGHGRDGFWTNMFETPLTRTLKTDIKRFGTLLTWMRFIEPILGLLPIWIIMNLFRFSKDFGARMVYPLMALFLGTDPLMKLWEYDPNRLLGSVPKMYAFPELREFYRRWMRDLEEDDVQIYVNSSVSRIRYQTNGRIEVGYIHNDQQSTITVDQLVFACEPSSIIEILGDQASWMQRKILGNVPYFHDVSVTHTDVDYMRKYYHLDSDSVEDIAPDMPMSSKFDPMYFIHPVDDHPGKVEMSFDCTRYQPQFNSHTPVDRHIFQTIFLNKSEQELWTKDEINKDKILYEKWWWQLGHRWSHYARTVLFLASINGRRNTYYAGSWTLVNMHEMAIVSGIACAIRLGAEYPQDLNGDPSASKLLRLYMLLAHWRWK
ncbi:hypothetical protein JR316_0003186 [Psilocybe cubensis]|uniref:Uncharacterized protein n=1 Tax=Psilocybe cubensis TaxID=181762 RepID=A0ACB8H969_PSICU|nr:hypothetical protein JR316_0003186 [Psilocybe cubensis]KAH9483710.1 hypothetical protein JR316_0003186 [Psilocybe cubensis]